MGRLVLVRHGQSVWNSEGRFTGWWDSDLTLEGEAEARASGALLREHGVEFSCAYTSLLTRAIRTLWLILADMDRVWVPVVRDYRLNERHYGALTGLSKAGCVARHGAEQVAQWRRSYRTAPPPMLSDSPYDVSGDRRYAGIAVPAAESLQCTAARVSALFDSKIASHMARGENIVVVAHGNSLRALMKGLFGIGDAEIASLEIPTGSPLTIEMSTALEVRAARYLAPDRAAPLPDLSAGWPSADG